MSHKEHAGAITKKFNNGTINKGHWKYENTINIK